MRFVAQRSHFERLMRAEKRDIKLYVVCQHCQSVLSWQAILLDAVSSAFRLRSLRRGRGGLSFAWQLFSCRFASAGITSFLNIPSPFTQKNQGNYKPFQKVFWKSASFTKGLFGFVDYAFLILPSIYKGIGERFLQPFFKNFSMPLTYMDKMKPFGRVFFKSSLINLRFAQR